MKNTPSVNINWDNAILYHGTCLGTWEKAFDKANKDVLIRIPIHEQHWLGRGLYFGVNNIITPVKFALRSAYKSNCTPIILEAPASYVKKAIRDNILDLTHHVGLLTSYIISNQFGEFTKDYNDEKVLKNIKNGLFKNKLYSDSVKTFFSLDKDWYLLMKEIEPVLRRLNTNNEIIDELRKNSTMNISNLIYDWFNYYMSSGTEKDVPIRAIVANFNTGSPLLYKGLVDEMSLSERTFYDFTTILSRTEISFLGYDYYRREEEWNLSNIFSKKLMEDPIIYKGAREIITFIARLIQENVTWISERECYEYAKKLYHEIDKERDQL